MDLSRRQYRGALAVILLVAFALRLGVAIATQGLDSPPDPSANPDQLEYEVFAYRLSIGEGFSWPSGELTASRPPGTSWTLLPVYLALGRSFAAGRIWFCLLSTLTCLATAWLARQCFGPRVALLAAAWLALYPGHFYYAMHFLSEVPFGLWLALAAGFTVRSLRHPALLVDVAAGICWGAAILTRPQMLPLAPLAFVMVLLASRANRRRYLTRLAIQAAVLALVLAPWVARNAVVIGKPTVTTILGGYGFWLGNNEVVLRDARLKGTCALIGQLTDAAHPLTGSEIEREALAWKYGREFVGTHLGDMPGLVAMKFWRFLSPFIDTPNRPVFWAFALGWGATLPFLAAGLLLAWRTHPLETAVLVAPLVVMLLITAAFYGLDRYRDALAPVLVIPAAYAASRLWGAGLGVRSRAARDP
jgi:4-amino-4-deoxy-L-arabinose transferase-like glycosyltransferase